MEMELIFNNQYVSVSYDEFIVNGKIHPIKNITSSAEIGLLKPERGVARLAVFGGLILLFGNENLPILGGILFIYGGVLCFTAKPRYSVVINIIGRKEDAYISENSLEVDNIVKALNIALGMREITF
ncbi:DUF6232 family protein [Methylophilus sp.]|uniref:DUF6232 family protein n=1 Tax=Methylophilus sp. TaxID=29541 RepID=UPI0040367C9C